ncbi:MAG: tetratricopeptide repeat protein [Deltaproteobacteria bacterium]|nr:tetratricopeptide repeat protein [Deltaproteobacteria bacterium]
MERSALEEAELQFELVLKSIEEMDYAAGLVHLEKALELHDDTGWHSYVGLLIALERGEFAVAECLCRASIEHDEANPVHYLNLGKVYLAAGRKQEALATLRKGMELGGNERILALLSQLGTRTPPFFRSLKRSHPLNKFLGILLHRRELRSRGLP